MSFSNGKLQLNNLAGLTLTLATVPETLASAGTPGNFAYDEDSFYLCVATDTWLQFPGTNYLPDFTRVETPVTADDPGSIGEIAIGESSIFFYGLGSNGDKWGEITADTTFDYTPDPQT